MINNAVIDDLLSKLYGRLENKKNLYLNSIHPDLSFRKPLDLIKRGEVMTVRNHISKLIKDQSKQEDIKKKVIVEEDKEDKKVKETKKEGEIKSMENKLIEDFYKFKSEKKRLEY